MDNVLTGGTGNDFFEGWHGNDTLVGGGGSDTYHYDWGDGLDVIINGTATAGVPAGKLEFGGGYAPDNLWFQRSGNDLIIRELGATDTITVQDWFAQSYRQLVSLILSDGSQIDTAAITGLVSAMSIYEAANPGFDPTASNLMPEDANLRVALATNWARTVSSSGTGVLAPSFGNNRVIGNGSDKVSMGGYTGLHINYQITQNAADGTYTLTGPTGTSVISGVKEIDFDDGYLSFDPDGNAAFEYRLYLAAFNRLPDVLGFSNNVPYLDQGVTRQQFADGIAGSPEFASRWGTLTNQQLVTQLFQRVLHVDAATSPDAARFVTGLNDGSLTKGDLVLWLANSDTVKAEVQSIVQGGIWVERPYASRLNRYWQVVLGHDMDPSVFGMAFELVSPEMTPVDLSNRLLGSLEFSVRYGTLDDTQFVTQMYQNALKRAPTGTELATELANLAVGATRADLVIRLADNVAAGVLAPLRGLGIALNATNVDSIANFVAGPGGDRVTLPVVNTTINVKSDGHGGALIIGSAGGTSFDLLGVDPSSLSASDNLAGAATVSFSALTSGVNMTLTDQASPTGVSVVNVTGSSTAANTITRQQLSEQADGRLG